MANQHFLKFFPLPPNPPDSFPAANNKSWKIHKSVEYFP